MHYKLYFLGRGDRIQRALDMECEDDAHAIGEAFARGEGLAMELWCGARMVKKFAPDEP